MVLFFQTCGGNLGRRFEKSLIGHDRIIERAYQELNRFSWNEEELLTYEQAEKYEGAYQASLAQKFDEGEKMGIEKGIEKGTQSTLLKVAKDMLKQGFSIEAIKAITGLSEKEIYEDI